MKTLKNILYVPALLAAVFIVIGIPTLLIQLFVTSSGIPINDDTLYNISGSAGIAVAAVICAVYVKKKYGNDPRKPKKLYPANAIAFTLLAVCLCKIIIEEITGVVLCRLFPAEVLPSQETGWIDYIFAIFLAPVFEELLFRYSIFGLLKNRFSERAAMLMSAAVFSLSHGYGLQGLISCFAFAVVMTVIYRRTNDIRYCILSHMGCNLFVSIINRCSNGELFGLPLQFSVNGYNILHPVIVILAAAFCICFFKSNIREKCYV